jgi:crotonobetainyl-CoA:carnitine CoA-transferase CaiB-like acyl-CoA transferase
MGSPSWSQQERFSTRSGRQQNYESLWEYISAWTRNYSKHEIAGWGQENHIPCFPVNTVDDLFGDEQFSFRNFFVETDHPILGTLKIPGVPYKLSEMDLHLIGSPAPFLGQHNKDLLGHS